MAAKKNAVTIVKLINKETGTCYFTKKNPKKPGKYKMRKYDKKLRQHATFVQEKV